MEYKACSSMCQHDALRQLPTCSDGSITPAGLKYTRCRHTTYTLQARVIGSIHVGLWCMCECAA